MAICPDILFSVNYHNVPVTEKYVFSQTFHRTSNMSVYISMCIFIEFTSKESQNIEQVETGPPQYTDLTLLLNVVLKENNSFINFFVVISAFPSFTFIIVRIQQM